MITINLNVKHPEDAKALIDIACILNPDLAGNGWQVHDGALSLSWVLDSLIESSFEQLPEEQLDSLLEALETLETIVERAVLSPSMHPAEEKPFSVES